MQPTLDTYPVFEANQVLTNAHLNQVFNYLDEQERLTRANLIGIGIVCGLEVRLEIISTAKIIHLSKGCGITSAGYLVMEPADTDLVSFREVKEDLGYAPFKDATLTQYTLWELFTAGETTATTLGSDNTFLDGKAVVLFLELKKAKLRTCSPNNCDDKGAEVTVRVRPMLIQARDLIDVIAKENQLAAGLTATDLEASLLARLNLPDLRLPRYDVPNTSPATSNAVLAAFHAVFQADKLVLNVSKALSAAYNAFKPVLQEETDPFGTFNATFSFLDQVPVTTEQVRFLQHYYDFFDDLIRGYDEFCRKGVELLCACCPPERLFPQHLMAGLVDATSTTNPGVYRHSFLPSSAVGGCEEREKELRQLFRRLVEMIAQFSPNPPLPTATGNAQTDNQIRITPSKLSDAPLSVKAIPYYYQQTGQTPLFQLWNTEKTRRNRANQNLSYRSNEYVPAAPAFVTNALRYDLEPYNFLRIEGHLGKDYQSVLSTLLTLKTQYRLPIEIVALRTGAFDEKMPVDLTKESARFQDIEALYDAFREELLATLAEGVRYLYDMPINGNEPAGTPQLPLLKKYAPAYRHVAGSLGAWYEKYQAQFRAMPYIDVDQNNIGSNTVLTVYCTLFAGTTAPDGKFFPHVVSIYYLTKLAEILPDRLDQLGFADFENKYQDLVGLTRYFRSDVASHISNELVQYLPQEELIDHFDQVLFACKLEPIRSIFEEYKRRIKEIKQKQFLSYFLQNNPGIQHKAGVPMGGTFILVYHDDPDPIKPILTANLDDIRATVADLTLSSVQSTINATVISRAFDRIRKDRILAANDDIRLVLGALTGVVPQRPVFVPPDQEDAAEKIIADTVSELADGTVIADFYLPYLCSSGSVVQFVLPKIKPSFTVEIGCTNENGQAEVTLMPKGGVAPYSVKVDDQDFQPLAGVLALNAGARKIVLQDAETTESNPQTIQIGQQLVLGEPQFMCSEDGANRYVVTFSIRGGKGPYTASQGTVDGNAYTSDSIPGDTDVTITITDSRSCTAPKTVNHSCLPPLDFTVQVGCTNPNNEAPVTILPTGGTSPYQVQINQAAPVSIEGPVTLPTGTYQLIVSDAAGASVAKTDVVVPPLLTLTLMDFSCGEGALYQAFIRVEGGTPPYTYKDTQIAGNGATFSTEPIPSGQSATVTVQDSAGCSVATDIQHTCEEPCNLPCGGQSRRGAYRLWIQPPSDPAPYKAYKQESAVTFRYNARSFDLANAGALLQLTAQQLNGNFQDAVGGAVKQLSKVINTAMNDALGDLGADRLALTYQPSADDPFGVLLIEYFTCDTFNIEFDYTIIKPNTTFSLHARYTNEVVVGAAPFDGAILTNRRSQKIAQVPAFEYNERNQCQRTDFKPRCDGPKPTVDATITRQRVDNPAAVLFTFTFTGKATGNTDPHDIIAWVWDVPLASEHFFEGQQVSGIGLTNVDAKVRLTAITTNGCFAITESSIPRQ